jgi:hypothetical protein
VLLRVSNERGDWIPYANLRFSQQGVQDIHGDKYGRILFAVRTGSRAEGNVVKLGFKEEAVKFECPAASTPNPELRIILRPM